MCVHAWTPPLKAHQPPLECGVFFYTQNDKALDHTLPLLLIRPDFVLLAPSPFPPSSPISHDFTLLWNLWGFLLRTDKTRRHPSTVHLQIQLHTSLHQWSLTRASTWKQKLWRGFIHIENPNLTNIFSHSFTQYHLSRCFNVDEVLKTQALDSLSYLTCFTSGKNAVSMTTSVCWIMWS